MFYDQLAMMSPIMLALTGSSPIYRGFLSDIDTRWAVIAASVDDRTPEERGLKPLEHNKYEFVLSLLSHGCPLSLSPIA